MKPIHARTRVLAGLSLAAGLLGATALAAASAAPLAPRAGLETDGGLLTQVKKDWHHNRNFEHFLEGVGAVIELSAEVCEAHVESCEDRYDDDEYRYQRCLRRAGCSGYGD